MVVDPIWLLDANRLLLRVAMLAVVFKFLSSAHRARRLRPMAAPELPADLPTVTVQLPVRNEARVAARVIRSAASLKYPQAKLEIQVLDDSCDETREIVDAEVRRASLAGTRASVLRRDRPTGYKAGAMAAGLDVSDADVVAVFDADFVIPRDFLLEAVGHLVGQGRHAFVQGRWDYLNRSQSWLTKVQAAVLDVLMLVDQPAQAARADFFQFNGTAGVWRRAALDEAGGLRSTSVTEDLDLSVRAFRAGWRGLQVPELVALTELPATFHAYRTQQERWTRGPAQVLRTTLPTLWSAPRLGFRSVVTHLGRRSIYLLLASMVLTWPATTLGLVTVHFEYPDAANAAVFGAVVAAFAVSLGVAAARAGRSVLGAVALTPCVLMLHLGIALDLSIALLGGLVPKQATFHRTPKVGDGPGAAHPIPFPKLAVLEGALAAVYACIAAWLVGIGSPMQAAFGSFVAASLGWVGFGALVEWLRAPRETAARGVDAETEAVPRP